MCWRIDEIAGCWVIMKSAISLGNGNRLGWQRLSGEYGRGRRRCQGHWLGGARLDGAKLALHPPNGLNVNGGVFGTSGWPFRK